MESLQTQAPSKRACRESERALGKYPSARSPSCKIKTQPGRSIFGDPIFSF